MKIFSIVGLMFLIYLTLGCSARLAGYQSNHFATPAKIAACVRNRDCHQIFIVSHRGNGFAAPENSREAIARAIPNKILFIEIDLRKSLDGGIFIAHDHSLNRTTGRNGDIRSMTRAELAGVRLKNGESLPEFADLYAVSRGRAILVLDFKNDLIQEVADWINSSGSFDDVIFYASSKKEIASAALAKKKYPRMIVMADIGRINELRFILGAFEGLPEILHVHFPLTITYARRLHLYGAKIFADSLAMPPPLQAMPLGLLLGAGIDFIEVNDPIFLMKLIGKN